MITGGASGIGLAMAQRFAGEGMKLVLADIERPVLQRAGEELSRTGADVLTVPTDVSLEADVTAHVDFQALVRATDDLGARPHGPVPQGDFLKRLGIENRAASLMAKASPEVSQDIVGALKRLVGGGRGGMGQMFKVLGISEPNLVTLAGFADETPDAKKAETP